MLGGFKKAVLFVNKTNTAAITKGLRRDPSQRPEIDKVFLLLCFQTK